MKLFDYLYAIIYFFLAAVIQGLNNFSKSAREMFAEIQKIDSNYYPEVCLGYVHDRTSNVAFALATVCSFVSCFLLQTLNQLYIINAGTGFRALWKVLKAFMESRTLAKVQVVYLFVALLLFDKIE